MKLVRDVVFHILNHRPDSTKRALRSALVTYRCFHYDQGENSRKRRLTLYAATLGITGLASTFAYKKIKINNLNNEDLISEGQKIFSRRDVSLHNSLDKGVWITYKGNVYDITSFIEHHPGGSHTIMMGAGGDVEPFWKTYTVHEAKEVQNLLSKYQIGVLSAEKQANSAQTVQEVEGPYANDPRRSPLLEVLTEQPFNAETPPKLLTPTAITPNEIFFVRNHLPVPEVDIQDYKLSICVGTDGDPDNQKLIAEFTLDDLKKKVQAPNS